MDCVQKKKKNVLKTNKQTVFGASQMCSIISDETKHDLNNKIAVNRVYRVVC